jgi:8-oxo-dGTP pyrophosphatase MutT (NUDIX family)/phosphohistidine phosphatase SixA
VAANGAGSENVGPDAVMTSADVVQAAGVVLLRGEDERKEVLTVHRPHRSDWSLPKGKVDPGEHLITAAVRETDEETGFQVILGPPLKPLEYTAFERPKRVSYWTARVRDDEGFTPDDEIDELRWLPTSQAQHHLTYPHDSDIVAEAAAIPETVPLILLRHTQALKRADFNGSDDAERPLSGKGRSQSKALIPLLDAFGITDVYASDTTRCYQTVRRFAKTIGTTVQSEPSLGERAHEEHPGRAGKRISELAHEQRPLVVCSHRPVLPTLVTALGQALDCPVRSDSWDARLPPGGFIVVHRAFASDGQPRLISVERHTVQPF